MKMIARRWRWTERQPANLLHSHNASAAGDGHTETNGRAIDLKSVLNAYRRYAPMYDVVFGAVFDWGRAAIAARVNKLAGANILEIGVGTGLSLRRYQPEKNVVGIDVCAEMLSVAKKRVASLELGNVSLAQMDGERLAFRDEQFDIVVALFVMSVTPNPHLCMAEMERVCAPGGVVLICNHFVDGSHHSLSGKLGRFSRWLGWRPDFRLASIIEDSPLTLEETFRVPPSGMFNVVALRKS